MKQGNGIKNDWGLLYTGWLGKDKALATPASYAVERGHHALCLVRLQRESVLQLRNTLQLKTLRKCFAKVGQVISSHK